MTTSIGPGFLQPKSWLLRHHDLTSSYIVWEMFTYQDIDVWVVRQSLLPHLTEHLVIPAFFYESAVLGLREIMATQLHLYPPIPEHALKIS